MDTNIIIPSMIVIVRSLVSWAGCWSRSASHCMQLHKAGLGYIKSVISHGAEHEHFLIFSLILDGVYSGVQLIGKLCFAIRDSTDTLLRQECENTSGLHYIRIYPEVLDECSCLMCFSFHIRNVMTAVLSLSMMRPCPLRGRCGRFESPKLSPWDSFMETIYSSIFQHPNLASMCIKFLIIELAPTS